MIFTAFRSGLESSEKLVSKIHYKIVKRLRWWWGGRVAVKSDARETLIYESTREDINDLLADG